MWLQNNSALNMIVYNFSHIKTLSWMVALLRETFRGLGSLSLSTLRYVLTQLAWFPTTSTLQPLG